MIIRVLSDIEVEVTFCVTEKHVYFTVKDSYKVKKTSDIRLCLDKIREQHDYKLLVSAFGYNRTKESEVREWEAHNLLYKLHVLRSRTGSTDIDKNESKFRKIGYFFLSKIYRLFNRK